MELNLEVWSLSLKTKRVIKKVFVANSSKKFVFLCFLGFAFLNNSAISENMVMLLISTICLYKITELICV